MSLPGTLGKQEQRCHTACGHCVALRWPASALSSGLFGKSTFLHLPSRHLPRSIAYRTLFAHGSGCEAELLKHSLSQEESRAGSSGSGGGSGAALGAYTSQAAALLASMAAAHCLGPLPLAEFLEHVAMDAGEVSKRTTLLGRAAGAKGACLPCRRACVASVSHAVAGQRASAISPVLVWLPVVSWGLPPLHFPALTNLSLSNPSLSWAGE